MTIRHSSRLSTMSATRSTLSSPLSASNSSSESIASLPQKRKRPVKTVGTEQAPVENNTGNPAATRKSLSGSITSHFRQTKRAASGTGSLEAAKFEADSDPARHTGGRQEAKSESASLMESGPASATGHDDYQADLSHSSETSRNKSSTTSPSHANAPGLSTTTTPRKRPSATATTNAVSLETAYSHLLSVEPRLQPYVAASPTCPFLPLTSETEPFESLVSCVIGQQVSGAAGRAIKQRFVALFNNSDPNDARTQSSSGRRQGLVEEGTSSETRDENGDVKTEVYNEVYAASETPFPSPSQIIALADPISTLRTVGLSQRKAEYIYGIAGHFLSGYLSNEFLRTASDAEVEERLLTVRGLGQWSVDMFCCFSLGRLDIFSTGDLGVQRGMAVFLGRNVRHLKPAKGKWKYMGEEEMLRVSAPFSPYRSLLMWLMWKVEGVDVSFMKT